MIAAAQSPESIFYAQYQYVAQAYMQYHAYQAKQCLDTIQPDQSRTCINSDLTMVSKLGIESWLSNPLFAIEGCLDSL